MSAHTTFQKSVIARAGEYSVPVIIPPEAQNISVAAHPGGGGGGATVYVSLSPVDEIAADPDSAGVEWVAWDEGEVTAPTVRGLSGLVTAVRLAATTSDGKLEVVVGRTR